MEWLIDHGFYVEDSPIQTTAFLGLCKCTFLMCVMVPNTDDILPLRREAILRHAIGSLVNRGTRNAVERNLDEGLDDIRRALQKWQANTDLPRIRDPPPPMHRLFF